MMLFKSMTTTHWVSFRSVTWEDHQFFAASIGLEKVKLTFHAQKIQSSIPRTQFLESWVSILRASTTAIKVPSMSIWLRKITKTAHLFSTLKKLETTFSKTARERVIVTFNLEISSWNPQILATLSPISLSRPLAWSLKIGDWKACSLAVSQYLYTCSL